MSWAGVKKRLCVVNDWMVIGKGSEVEDEEQEDHGEEDEGDKGDEEEEEESFSLFDADLCHSHPDSVYLDKTLQRVSRLLAFLNLEVQDVIYIHGLGKSCPLHERSKVTFIPFLLYMLTEKFICSVPKRK